MIELKKLEETVLDQSTNFLNKKAGVKRLIDFDKYLKTNQIIIISGIRRSGKSTLLRQFADKLKNFYYINFDDERLINFEVSDFNNLLILWQKHGSSKNILIDEIQNIDKWERFIRRIHDEGFKVFLTGSNAKLLSSELATHLTGRYFKIELFPFSFKEMLLFNNAKIKPRTSKDKAEILKLFDSYLAEGGFPEYQKFKDEEYLKGIYNDIIYKDIITRFGIRETKPFRELTSFLFTNFTKETSYNSLKKLLNIKSPVSVKNYISFLEESYLLFELYMYDSSLKKQYVSNKKIYVIDNGMRNSIAFHLSEDRGRLLENLVFLELKRRNKEVYFFRDKYECDFIVKEKNRILEAIQVTEFLDKSNEEREINGLISALKKFKLKEGIILTENQEEKEYKVADFKVLVRPVWKWLLEE